MLLINGCSDNTNESEKELVQRAYKIHNKVLTLDTHADTPLRMIEPGFDMSVRHDPKKTGSKVDYPRMKEGDLDAIFFAAFVAQDIRDDDGNGRAKSLCLQMIDSIKIGKNNYIKKKTILIYKHFLIGGQHYKGI